MWLRFAAKKSDTQKVLLQDLQSAVSSGRVQGLAVDEDHIVNVAPEEPGRCAVTGVSDPERAWYLVRSAVSPSTNYESSLLPQPPTPGASSIKQSQAYFTSSIGFLAWVPDLSHRAPPLETLVRDTLKHNETFTCNLLGNFCEFSAS